MQLDPNFIFGPLPISEGHEHTPFPMLDSPLGPLQDLPGRWTGRGFNVIWRPSHTPGQDRFLELNVTDEALEFVPIKGPIPNRGLLQPDIDMFGIGYLQQITDANLNVGLHFEPGLWAVVPATTNPLEAPTVVRMASIPHGTVVLAQGSSFRTPTPPNITSNDITPFQIGNPASKINFPESNLSIPSEFRSQGRQLNGISQAMLDNPNSVLIGAIPGQNIIETTILVVSSDASSPVLGGGVANTAFLQGAQSAGPNAQTAVVSATFWIEHVKGDPDFLQLQYTQRVLLNFNGLSWPHISVATLRKQPSAPVPADLVDPDFPVAANK
jgi:hypothetical protein